MTKVKRTMIVTIFMITASFLNVLAQDTIGIHFEQKLKWSEILAKAKKEHKYIFADCYATWCGPCKLMEHTVYPLKEVGEAYNTDFISVKVQMDRTGADDSLTKSRYQRADMFAENYHVNAYPTFLFFSPDGNAVHKIVGGMDAKAFIQLAADARNPDKQYYTLLKNFQPGKLDTGEERSLARTFAGSDPELAAQLALDYLNRVPKTQLKMYNCGQLMSWFQNNPKVLNFSLSYIHNLHRKELISPDNLSFLVALSGKPEVKQIAKNIIGQLTEKEMLINKKAMLDFLATFSTSSIDKGFKFVYHHVAHADTIANENDWAQSYLTNIISAEEIQPKLEQSKQSGNAPDFKTIANNIIKKYNAYYAKRIIEDAKVDWYGYQVNDNKDSTYWPQFTQAEIDKEQRYLDDPQLSEEHATDINDACYGEIFLHSDDTAKTSLAVKWMKHVITNYPNPDNLDTYACLLYKSGKTDEALAIEQKVMQWCIDHKAKGTMIRTKHTTMVIEKMKAGDKIWQEKGFRD